MNRRHFTGLSPFRQRPCWGAVPSLPAGINEDDSDPHGGQDRGVQHLASPRGHMTPRFGGGRYRPPRFSWFGTGEADG